MIFDRVAQEQFEMDNLASYAQKSAASRGRQFPEPRHSSRTEFQRDRDRIVHSRSFRRLEYKTQVFLNGTGDHYRTRLTHTIEVAAIARTIARALRLNEDLSEAIALAHDLGHSPFGHSGERTLNRLMKNHGGFEHNRQSLRIVGELEQKYARFDGLNLTWETREGLGKHVMSRTPSARKGPRTGFRQPSLESQITNVADEIAYYSHDLDDGLEAGLLSESALASLEIWREATRLIRRECRPGLVGTEERKRYLVIRWIISREVEDVISTSEKKIVASGVQQPDEVRLLSRPLISYSPQLTKQNHALRQFLYRHLYFNPEVRAVNLRACTLMEELFRAYLKNPKLLGSQTRKRIRHTGLARAVCDYIAGMTDRYAIEQWKSLKRA